MLTFVQGLFNCGSAFVFYIACSCQTTDNVCNCEKLITWIDPLLSDIDRQGKVPGRVGDGEDVLHPDLDADRDGSTRSRQLVLVVLVQDAIHDLVFVCNCMRLSEHSY